jgi:soluble lytic murein transglycosylase-like protein
MCPVGPAGSDPLGDLRRWGRFFDGSAERPRFNEDHIHAVMASEGVSHGIVDSVIEESRRQGADPVLVLSVMKKESSFNPKARSNKGARGLMQVMPATGRTYGVKSPSKLYDPNTNIRVGVAFLKNTFDEFSSAGMQALAAVNPFSDSGVKAAIAAYNAGEGSVRKFKGVPPFRETRKFVAKVLEFYADYRGKLEALAEDSGGL